MSCSDPSRTVRLVLDRRKFLGAAAAGLLGGCHAAARSGRSLESSAKEGGLRSVLPVREEPLRLDLFPLLAMPVSEEHLQAAARTVLPPVNLKKYPLAVVYHALRLWGPEATLDDVEFLRSDLEGCFGRKMLEIMLDERAFRSLSAALIDHVLEPSEYGVFVRTTADPVWGREAASTHPGTYLQVCGESGVASARPLFVGGTTRFAVADVVRDEARRVHPDGELEWTVNGLGRYLEIRRWQNRFGEWVGFDRMAGRLLEEPWGRGPCLGTHVPYALAALVNLQRHSALMSAECSRRVIQRLKEIGALLSERQGKDGAWDQGWSGDAGAARPEPPVFDIDINPIIATGHHLEWMTICPPEYRPEPAVIARAAEYLAGRVVEIESFAKADWHRFLPFSHAGKALFGLRGNQFAVWPGEADRESTST